MADVSGLRAAVEDRAMEIMEAAVDGMKDRLESVVPIGTPDVLGRGRSGRPLRDTYEQRGPNRFGSVLSAEIGYESEKATFTNELMPPHRIPTSGNARPRLRFFWDLTGQEMVLPYVNHPGNVGAASLGWWDRTVTPVSWRLEVEIAAGY